MPTKEHEMELIFYQLQLYLKGELPQSSLDK
mgnify:CR=1 FL=1